MTRIFILNGHPAETSLSKDLSLTYERTAKANGHEVRILHLHDLKFDIDYGYAGYTNVNPLEPDLQSFFSDLEWCERFVVTTPMWWGGLPGKLKGLFDRTLLPGRAFDTHNTTLGMPAPMLRGRSSRVIVTADTPKFLLWLLYGNAMLRQTERQILGFIGLKPVKTSYFAPASHPKPKAVSRLLDRVQKLAAKAA